MEQLDYGIKRETVWTRQIEKGDREENGVPKA